MREVVPAIVSALDGALRDPRSDDDDPAQSEAALLALGGTRDPRAFSVIKSHESRFLPDPRTRELYLASIAMTRRPEAIDYLFDLATTGPRDVRPAAMAALEPLRAMPPVAARLDGSDRPQRKPR